jgi:hypothetical protein
VPLISILRNGTGPFVKNWSVRSSLDFLAAHPVDNELNKSRPASRSPTFLGKAGINALVSMVEKKGSTKGPPQQGNAFGHGSAEPSLANSQSIHQASGETIRCVHGQDSTSAAPPR